MQGNVGYNTLFADTTAPFLFQTLDGFNDPSTEFFNEPHVYGYSTILSSNMTAAVLDAPVPDYMFTVQQSLLPGSVMNVTAEVRATVVEYNSTVEDYRDDTECWEYYYNRSGMKPYLVWGHGDGLKYGFMQTGLPQPGTVWDGSWIFANTFDPLYMNITFESLTQYALRFDARRHHCKATWQVTRSSIQLVSGDCDKDPLEAKYQVYTESELGIGVIFPQALAENLGTFTRARKHSPWLIPTHTMVIASIYHTVFAANNATIKIQADGLLAESWNVVFYDSEPHIQELYSSSMTLEERVPALRATIGLYLIMAIQPALTVFAYCAVLMMYSVPIGRTFGLVSIMAGIDRTTLDLITGAGFSGELHKPVGLNIEVVPSPAPHSLTGRKPQSSGYGQAQERIEYRLGEAGFKGTVKRRRVYW